MTMTDRLVVLTGAGGGIGSALVERLAGAGARLVLSDRADARFDPRAIDAAPFDLLDRAACEAAAQRCLARHGAPDIVISNAGFTRAETLATTDTDAWDAEMAINLSGVRHFTAPLVAAMRRRGRGTLVFVASVNAIGHYGNPAYSAAKAGLLAYMRAIAVEAGPDGVRANAVCPGSVRTPAWDHRFEKWPGLAARITPLYPLRRMVEPGEVADAVLFLASDAASGITGAVLPVDAGLTAGNPAFVDAIS
ncbi:SDR family oxidoreductase [Aureimonas altamirensis]|uniref:SDR family NAD(P)-dependent oxidoreductase n=1 Tax=Aureimonas altamirensis TaxID=370622 RepID=UPI002036F9F3|nr:SDR family oxidoreductase [Aureimonas altamirensis]MCM2502684.1 SDR family oxidoreductase [Aureimonas altamirensis]